MLGIGLSAARVIAEPASYAYYPAQQFSSAYVVPKIVLDTYHMPTQQQFTDLTVKLIVLAINPMVVDLGQNALLEAAVRQALPVIITTIRHYMVLHPTQVPKAYEVYTSPSTWMPTGTTITTTTPTPSIPPTPTIPIALTTPTTQTTTLYPSYTRRQSYYTDGSRNNYRNRGGYNRSNRNGDWRS